MGTRNERNISTLPTVVRGTSQINYNAAYVTFSETVARLGPALRPLPKDAE